MLVSDSENRIIAVNGAFSRLTGYSASEAIGQNPRILASGNAGPEFYSAMWEGLSQYDFWEGEIWDKRRDGSLYPNQTVTAADFLAVLIPGAAGRRPLADAVPVPDSVPVYARRAVGQAVAEGLIAPEALTKPLNRSNAAEICRRLHI